MNLPERVWDEIEGRTRNSAKHSRGHPAYTRPFPVDRNVPRRPRLSLEGMRNRMQRKRFAQATPARPHDREADQLPHKPSDICLAYVRLLLHQTVQSPFLNIAAGREN